VPEHAELAWVLNCITRIGELDRMTQFKEKRRTQRENTGVGFFDYPVLMAADILLYQTNLVPVGEDQKQHLELTRDLAMRFNRDYGETFSIPDPFIPKVGARIMSLSDPTKKMAKSDENPNGSIALLDDADTIRRKFKRAVTDSGAEIRFDKTKPALSNLLTIYRILTQQPPEEIEEHFAGLGYAQLKGKLADLVIEFLQPFQERVRGISDEELDRILEMGRERASSVACATMEEVKTRVGLHGAHSK
jgi:tryptophanyl-tRNA synthetase